jgi:hypothetical protein
MNPTQATLVSILPLLVGGIFTAFKGLLEDKERFEQRCTRLLTMSADRIARSLVLAIKSEIRRGPDEIAIEDGNLPSPLHSDVASLIAKHARLSYRISVRRDVLNFCRGANFLGIGIGIAGLLATHLFPGHESLIAWVCIATVCIEVAAVRTQYALTRRSEDDEDIL